MTRTEHQPRRPSIADPYRDLLAPLNGAYRDSLILRLTHGYYEGWRPTRRELMALIAAETGQHTGLHPAAIQPAMVRQGTENQRAESRETRPSPMQSTADPAAGPPRRSPRPSRGGARTQPDPAHRVIAEFDVDCGELAPGFRFVAHSLSTTGMTKRGADLCRLVFLNYSLRPLTDRAGQPRPTLPMTFSAPIICIPDHLVPWVASDGKERQHTVENNAVTGRRGPWPLAEPVQRVGFAINQQTPAGIPPPDHPVGILLVVMDTGRAVWRPDEQQPHPSRPTGPAGALRRPGGTVPGPTAPGAPHPEPLITNPGASGIRSNA